MQPARAVVVLTNNCVRARDAAVLSRRVRRHGGATEVGRKPSVNTLLARRKAEDDRLRVARETLRAHRAEIDAKIAEIDAMLGVAEMRDAPRPRQAPARTVCADCGIQTGPDINADSGRTECPVCHASPFEARGEADAEELH